MPVEDGRYIATDYGVSYYAVGTHEPVGNDNFLDAYVKLGNYWVPTSRVHTSTMKGKPGRVATRDQEPRLLEVIRVFGNRREI